MLGASSGLSQQLDDPSQRYPDLPGHVWLIVSLFVASGLAGKDDPSAGTINRDAVGKATRLGPFCRLQGKHVLSSKNKASIL
jgi:hypothetical protein